MNQPDLDHDESTRPAPRETTHGQSARRQSSRGRGRGSWNREGGAMNKCTRCGKPARVTLCDKCMADQQARQKRYRQRNAIHGKCVYCGKPVVTQTLCKDHVEKTRLGQRKWRRKKLDAGLCPTCGGELSELDIAHGYVICGHCTSLSANRQPVI